MNNELTDKACLVIRQYLRRWNAQYAGEANLCNRWNGYRDIMLSEECNLRIVLRLEDRRGPHTGQMSLIVHSLLNPADKGNELLCKAASSVAGFVSEDASGKMENNTYGVVGRVYLPSKYSWQKLDEQTLKEILNLYNRIMGALTNAGVYA